MILQVKWEQEVQLIHLLEDMMIPVQMEQEDEAELEQLATLILTGVLVVVVI